MTSIATVSDNDFLITEEEEEACTYGDCWRLAQAMNELYGFQIAFYGPISETPEDNIMWVHCFIALPGNDLFVDVTGVINADELDAVWSDFALENVDMETYQYDTGTIHIPPQDIIQDFLEEQEAMYPEVDVYNLARKLYEQIPDSMKKTITPVAA